MKTSFSSFTAAAERHPARSGFAFAALVAGAVFTTSVAIQPAYAVAPGPVTESMKRPSIELFTASVNEPLIDRHDFINPEKSPEASSTIELERLFWMCDYAATTGTLEAHEIEMCGAVTEQLRLAKFDNDFDKLLAWWRVNKETEHLALEGAGVIGHCAQGDKQ